MNKRMIAVGSALVLGLGAATAVADDSVNLANGSVQGNNQQVWLNQQPQQNQPEAGAVADASGNSLIAAGSAGNGAVGSGNAAVFSFTAGGIAGAGASNNNSTNAFIAQGNSQRTRQLNGAIAVKVTLKNSPIVIA